MRQMHSDLMGTPGLQLAGQQRGGNANMTQNSVISYRVFAMFNDDGHSFALSRVPADVAGDGARSRVWQAPAEGQVGAFQVMRREGGGEPGVGELRLGRDHDAGCVFIQPVDDARAPFGADAGQAVAAMRDECVNQRAVGIAGGGVHNQACRLVEHDEIRIFIQYGEGDILARRRGGDGGRRADEVGGARLHGMRRIGEWRAVLGDESVEDEGFEARARDIGVGGQVTVYAQAGIGFAWREEEGKWRLRHRAICAV